MSATYDIATHSNSPVLNLTEPTIPHILIVADQPARLLTYESILKGVGVQCIRALTGAEALERLSQQSFTLILIDVSKSDMQGFEAARMLREHPAFQHTPVIFVSNSHPSELDTLRAYEVGAIDFMQVPVVPEILRSKVALVVELYRRRDELERVNRELLEARAKLERERGPQEERESVKTRERRASTLLKLGDRLRSLTSPADLAYAAAELLGETLGVSRCGYGTIDINAETITIERDWNAPGVKTIAGTLLFREYGSYIEELKLGQTVVCEDADQDERTQATAAALKTISARSFVNMPVTEQEGTVALFYLNHATARSWTVDELSLMREFAERTRVAVERRRSEQAAAADLRDTRLLRDLAARLIAGDGQSVIDEILSAAMSITEADCGTVQLLEDDETLVFMATCGAPAGLQAHFERVDATSGSPCGLALAQGTRIFMHFDVPEAQDPDGSLRLHVQYGLRSGQSTPLITRDGRPLGMFSTHWRQKRVLTERETRFLDLLARQAADVIERVQSDQALRSREEQLRQADRRKDEFIAVLAHELRNPLVPIRTGVELLKKAHQQPAILDTVRPMMERQVQHIVHLIDDLLDVSRITSGTITLQRQRISLSTAIAPAIDANRDAINAGGFNFSVQLSDPQFVLEVDPTRFAQVVSNLLQNATKFTPAGGTIIISSDTAQDVDKGGVSVSLHVKDSGRGIASAALPGIFDLFQHRGRKDLPSQGLGIGLALSRRLIEMHGGTLLARSNGEGSGSVFTVSVPALAGLQPSGRIEENQPGSLTGARILVVDDNQDAANTMAMLISNLGAETRVAYDGPSGLVAANEFLPNVVLLDIGMPAMDGYEVCRRIRRAHGLTLPLVALTGWSQAQDKEEAVKAGFTAHLTKPADPAALVHVLRELILPRSLPLQSI